MRNRSRLSVVVKSFKGNQTMTEQTTTTTITKPGLSSRSSATETSQVVLQPRFV